MISFTLAELFGANAVQTATTLTITKADLASTGLIPSATNSSESLLSALVLNFANQFAGSLLTQAGDTITTEDGYSLDFSIDDSIYQVLYCYFWQGFTNNRNGLNYWFYQFLIEVWSIVG